jgi:succinoglycan biosynthesis transport protein ExoP
MTYMRPQELAPWQTSHAPTASEPPPFHWLPYLLSFLRRRWPPMASCLGVCLGLAVAYVLTTPPRFTAQVELMIDISRADLLRRENSSRDALTLNSMMESQVQLLQSAGLARKTVQRLGLDGTRHFVTPPDGPLDLLQAALQRLRASHAAPASSVERTDAAAQRLLTMLKVHRIGQTYVIGISVTSTSADEAAWLANGLADAYLADELQAKEDGIHQASEWLQVRIQELHDQALVADRAVQDYKAAHNIVDTDRGLMSGQQLTEISSQLVSARAATAAMLARLQRIESIMRSGVDGGNVTDGLDNKVIIGLRQQYVDDDRRIAELTTKFGRDHTAVRDLRNEMVEVKKSVQGELARIAETYKSDYEVAHASEVSLQIRLEQMVTSSAQTNNDLVLLRSLQSSADTYRALYQNFLQRYTQAVQDQSFPVPEARVVTTALPPQRKSAPRAGIILAFAVALGGALGFVAAFVQETLDTGVRNAAQLRATTGADCLGLVPRLKLRRNRIWLRRRLQRPNAGSLSGLLSAPGDILRHVVDAPRSPFAAAIRALQMRIVHQHLRSQDLKVIGCISSSPRAGSSTIAANLAHLLAKTGGRTILLDWDVLNASLSQKLGGNFATGWLDSLAGRVGLDAALQRDRQTGLGFLPTGQTGIDSLPNALSLPTQMHALLAELRNTYAYVVVDLPSLPAVADTHYAAHLLDAIVVVMPWGQTEPAPLPEILARIGLDETNVLGVVLNKADMKDKWNDAPPVPEYAVHATRCAVDIADLA